MTNLQEILDDIASKKADYKRYDFNPRESLALKVFFDLAQEYDDLKDIQRLCVSIPKGMFNLDARLYLVDHRLNDFRLAASTDSSEPHPLPPLLPHPLPPLLKERGLGGEAAPLPNGVKPAEKPFRQSGSLFLTIRGKQLLSDQLPSSHIKGVVGVLELFPDEDIPATQELFFEKYANRIGYNIHNRLLLSKNIEHLKFIQNLVADIEHNIIVPNMIFKLFLRRINGKIVKNAEIETFIKKYSAGGGCDEHCIERLLEEMSEVNRGLTEEYNNINVHYKNTTLFLETLFRKSHFDKGHLTLRTKRCNMKKDIILPQMERFTERFREEKIDVHDRFESSEAEEEIITVIDIGLMAQVYANLFSNALKYADEVQDEAAGEDAIKTVKFISFGREIVESYFGRGKDGVKYYVTSSGKNIAEIERASIFEEGRRGSNVANRPGTGHGLTFIKNAVEIHGGVVGYEAEPLGNKFYFVLPR
jgi:signal transduction histidine kinase